MIHHKHDKDSEYVSVNNVLSTNKRKIGPANIAISEIPIAKKEHNVKLKDRCHKKYCAEKKLSEELCAIFFRKEQQT